MTSKKTKVSMIDALAHFNDLPDCAYVRRPIVEALHSCTKSTIWRMVKNGTLPPPKRLSERMVAWQVGELRASMAARSAK